jgi:hypothetical protein
MAHYDIKFSPGYAQSNSTQEGNSIISKPGPVDYTEGGWYGGYDDAGSYLVVSDTNSTSLSGRPTANGTGTADSNLPTFWKVPKNDSAILNLINKLPGSPGGFTTATDAKAWLGSSPNYGLVTGADAGISMLVFGDVNGTLNYWTVTPGGTSGPVDLGSGYSYNDGVDWYRTDKGFMIYSYRNNWVAFISADGTLLDSRYYSNLGDYGNMQGKWLYVKDNSDHLFAFSDGNTFSLIDWSSQNDYYIDYNYDAYTLNGGLIMGTSQGSQHSFYMVNHTTTGLGNLLATWDNSLYQVQEEVYAYGDFIHLIKQDRNDGYHILESKIVNNSGTVLQTVDLSSENIYNWDTNMFGHGKMNNIFYNNGDSSQDWIIHFYDGDTDRLITSRHTRGDNYYNWDYYYRSFYADYGESKVSENFILIFYDNGYGYSCQDGVCGYLPNYMDLIPYFGGDTSARSPFVFQNSGSGTKLINSSFSIGDNFLTQIIEDYGNSNTRKLMSITRSGVSYQDAITFSDNNDWYDSGNRYLYVNWDTNFLTLLSLDGTILDTLDCSEGSVNINHDYNTFIILTATKARYINNAHSTFQTMLLPSGSYYEVNSNGCEGYTGGQHIAGNYALMNRTDYTIQIVSDNGYAYFNPGLNFDIGGRCNYGMSKNTFYFMFNDTYGHLYVQLYDLNGNLLNSQNLDYDNWSDNGIVEDTIYFVIQKNGTYKNYIMTASSIYSVDIDFNYNYQISSYNYYDC